MTFTIDNLILSKSVKIASEKVRASIIKLEFLQLYSLETIAKQGLLTPEFLEDPEVIGFPDAGTINILGASIAFHYRKKDESLDALLPKYIDQCNLHQYIKINGKAVEERYISNIIETLERKAQITLNEEWFLPISYLSIVLQQIEGYIQGTAIVKYFTQKKDDDIQDRETTQKPRKVASQKINGRKRVTAKKQKKKDEEPDSTTLYLLSIGKFPLLSAAKEKELFKQFSFTRIDFMKKALIIGEQDFFDFIQQTFDANYNSQDILEMRKYLPTLQERYFAELQNNTAPLDSQLNYFLKQITHGNFHYPLYEKMTNYLLEHERNVDELEQLLPQIKALQDKTINHNLRYVVTIAKKFIKRSKYTSFIDIILYGNLGLLNAVYHFDIARGNRITTYATHWIKQQIRRNIDDKENTIRIPIHEITEFHKSDKYWSSQLGIETKDADVPKNIMSYERYSELNALRNCISLEKSRRKNNGKANKEYEETLADDNNNQPDNLYDAAEKEDRTKSTINNGLASLKKRDEEILRMRFGIGYKESYTLEEVGEKMNLTRERIRQIEDKALDSLYLKKDLEEIYEDIDK